MIGAPTALVNSATTGSRGRDRPARRRAHREIGTTTCHNLTVDRGDWQAGARVAAELHRGGADLDAITARLIAEGLGPIPTYRAVRAGTGADYVTAKSVLHRNLPPALQQAAEDL